jgi:hypothetical protein
MNATFARGFVVRTTQQPELRYFSQRLSAALQFAGLGHGELARVVGVNRVTVTRWVGGVVPHQKKRRRIEERMSLPHGWLDIDAPPPADLSAVTHFARPSSVREEQADYLTLPRDGTERPTGPAPRETEEALAMIEGAVKRVLEELMISNELQRNPDRKRRAIRALKDLAQTLGALQADVSDLWSAIDQIERQWPDISEVDR